MRCSRRPVAVIGLLDAEYRLGTVVEGSLTVRSRRGVLAASVCLLAVPVALLFQLIVGSGAEMVLHLVGGVGCLLTACLTQPQVSTAQAFFAPSGSGIFLLLSRRSHTNGRSSTSLSSGDTPPAPEPKYRTPLL